MRPEANLERTRVFLTYHQLMGRRLHLQSVVRLIFAVLIVAGGFFADHLVGIADLPTPGLALLGVAVALYNIAAWLLTRGPRLGDPSPEAYRRIFAVMHGVILADFAALTVGVWLVGGARSPFLAFYLLHVVLSYVTLSRRTALTFSGVAYTLIVVLVVGEWSGVLPPHLPGGAVGGAGELDGRYAVTILVVYGLLLGIVSFLLHGVIRQLRQGERRIRLANEELTRLSELRKDFLRTALHNLKSPIGAVTMFLRNMKDGLGGPVTEKQAEWLDRSLKRLAGLSEFMSDMQTLASLDAGMIEAEATEFDVGRILSEVVEENQDLAEGRGHRLTLETPRSLPPIVGFERMLKEALVNYVTNAVKFTQEGGHITVRAIHRPPVLRIEVEDDGPGISEEDQGRLFAEFVRLHLRTGTAPDARSSGLGLSIARRIVEAQGGVVGVESEPGRGSTFYMELPTV